MRRCLRATGRAMVQFSLLVHPDSIREFQQPRGFRHPLYRPYWRRKSFAFRTLPRVP